MGTNHTNDKGQEAINAAVTYYDNHKNLLAIAGANRSAEEQNQVKYFTLKEVKFAYVSYTTSSQKPPTQPFSINLYNAATAKKQLEEARKQAQFVIVSINWGKEDSGDVQPEQETIAQELVTAGADLVIGNGPHIVQPAKVLNGADGRQGLVWFCLGNAVNSQLPSDNLFGGIGVVNIDVATQHMTDPGFLPTYMHYEWTPEQKRKPDLNARTNLMWYPLDAAKDALAKSQNGTTIEAQTTRLKNIITKYVPVKMLISTEL
jgi:poly-gamma-glutamate synthesis protein (capsule biosynthesis protein)